MLKKKFLLLELQISDYTNVIRGNNYITLFNNQILTFAVQKFLIIIDYFMIMKGGIFLRRIEWEQEVGNTYSAGEAAWSNAYNEVLKERQKWEAKAKALFESGEAVFRQASKNLQEAIAAAKEEFLRDAELRTQAGSDRAKAWVDTYVTTGSVVAGSRENVKFWYGKYKSQDAPALDSDGYTAWIQEEIRGFWSAMAGTFQNRSEYQTLVMQVEAARPDAEKTKGEIEAEYQRLTSQLADIEDRIKKTFVLDERIVLQLQYNATQGLLAQIQPWMNDYGKMHTAAVNKYNAALTALRPEQVLLDEIRAVVDGKRSLEQQEQIISALGDRGLSLGAQYDIALELVKWSDLYYAYQTRALEARDALVNDFGLVMGTGALVDILQDGASSEDFNLDEYQIELIRAQAVAGYWQKRVDIAKAVNQYAEDLTAGRMTDAEGVRAWEEAKAAYDQALVVYAEAQGTLTKAGDDVKAAQIVVAEASQTLAQIDAELDKLNREYAAKMAAYQLNQNTFLLNEMAALYGELLKVNNLLKTDSSSLYITYLEKARGLGVAQMVESGANYLSQLITGVGTGNGISLVDLTREYEGIPEVTTIDDLSGNIEGFNLTESNLYYGVITGLLDEQAEKLNGITAEEKITAIKNQYGALIIEAVKSAKAYAGQLVQDRVIAMGLLAADDVTSWYYAYSGRTNEGVDKEALVQQGIYERLNEELTEAQWDSFASQIALEAAALEYYLDNTADVSEEAKKLSVFFSLEETAGPAVLSELQNLLALLDSRNSLDVVDLQRKLETFNGVSGLVSLFMQGGGLFTVQGRSLASIFLTSDTIKVENLSSMMQVYEEINFGSSAVEWENIT
ncbi:hypothetical protein LJC14_07415, partial [Treponema sp. OttesenSCG-928-L16]|nr:hypothetical protein [Treponema sp. OttesenSCG-928-L16]